MHALLGTRPDIAFAVSTVAQFSDNPLQVERSLGIREANLQAPPSNV